MVFGFGHTMRSLSDNRPGFKTHSEILRDFYALKRCSEHCLTQYDQKQIHNIIQESPEQQPVKLLKSG